MAQDITGKQATFAGRYSDAITALLDVANLLTALNSEWSANGYATGAPEVENTNWNIPDAQVQQTVPAATAAMLNSAVGGVASVLSAINSNLGYLIVMKR